MESIQRDAFSNSEKILEEFGDRLEFHIKHLVDANHDDTRLIVDKLGEQTSKLEENRLSMEAGFEQSHRLLSNMVGLLQKIVEK